MYSIVLTEKHKSKLLEMCKELFTKDTIYKIDNFDNIVFLINHRITKLGKNSLEGWDKKLYIHWFEFCITHLVNKIFESFEEDDEDFYDRYINNGASFYGVGVNEMIFVMLSSRKHPIDYLYKEFKKLKK